MADDEHHSAFSCSSSSSSPPIGSWSQNPHVYPHSHHGTPAQEYSGFNFTPSHLPMEPSAFSGAVQQRPVHQQLRPLIMPQWPSMLNSQSQSTLQPIFPQPVQPIQPMSLGSLPTPVSANSSRSTSTPRKTLSDLDRKRMCQYAEEHPNSKQTEIGAIFGVERSTVSKVLRQREKYLLQDDGSRSPGKRITKGRPPDIERALAVWAKNQGEKEKKGLPLTDELIRDKARAFAATTTTVGTQKSLSSSWIEKFKLKHNLLDARSRKGSLAPDDADSISGAASALHTPNGTSPVSPLGIGSPSAEALRTVKSQESLKNESPDSVPDFASSGIGPFHSQSNTSLHSAFTDTTPSLYSPNPLSPASPIFTPDSGIAPSLFVPPPTTRVAPPTTASFSPQQRSRSQTLPFLDQQYIRAIPAGPEAATRRYRNSAASMLEDSPMEEAPNPLVGQLDGTTSPPHTVSSVETMRPPPLPAHVLLMAGDSSTIHHTTTTTTTTTSPEDARRALEVVLSFFEQQPHGSLDFQESVTIGKLMEKLRLQSRRAA